MWDVTAIEFKVKGKTKFLLTHPVWDVTMYAINKAIKQTISTHTSRVGCDPSKGARRIATCIFLLTHPVWDVTYISDSNGNVIFISTHTSRVGCDNLALNDVISTYISTHTSRVGCDGDTVTLYRKKEDFYSHIPCGM